MPAAALSADPFIERWSASGAAERANYQLFLSELCDLLDLPRPDPTRADDAENTYVFERNVQFQEDDGSTSTGRIDLYRRGAFVLEAKQGSDAETDEELSGRALARIIHGRVGETPDLSRGSSWRLRGRGAGRMPPFPQVG